MTMNMVTATGMPTRTATVTEREHEEHAPFAVVVEDRGGVAGEKPSGAIYEKDDPMKKFMTMFTGAMVASMAVAPVAMASEGAAGGQEGLIALAAGLAMGVGALGCGLGQGRAVASAMESIGRNPNSADRLQTPMIIGLALIESIAIYALVIAFFLQGKI